MGPRGMSDPCHMGPGWMSEGSLRGGGPAEGLGHDHLFQDGQNLFWGAIPATLGVSFAPAIHRVDSVGSTRSSGFVSVGGKSRSIGFSGAIEIQWTEISLRM